MSCHHNEAIKENILMGVLDMEESDIIEELDPQFVESQGLDCFDLLVDALVEKRYEEDPRQQ